MCLSLLGKAGQSWVIRLNLLGKACRGRLEFYYVKLIKASLSLLGVPAEF